MSTRPTVLIVEDDAVSRTIICEYLRSVEFDVREAESADEAISQLTADPGVKIVMSDVFLSGDMDGIGLARLIEEKFKIPVVLASGTASLPEADFDGFGDRFIPKPYVHTEVERRLRELLARRPS